MKTLLHVINRGVVSGLLRQGVNYFHRKSIPALFHQTSPLSSRMAYQALERGSPFTLDYRVYFKNSEDTVISPFHDIPLFADKEQQILNMVVEIPRWSNAKMEIDTTNKMNPIKQDIKKGNLRFVNNCFPHHGYIWNYGALPQTWEDPEHTDVHTGQKGDNDPLDVCEIGFKVHKRGAVIQVKVLGVMALIDEGETDWKVLAIDVTDPLAEKLNDVQDIETHMPGFLKATHEWFKIYKMPTGKEPNVFAFNGEAKDKNFAMDVIRLTNKQWQTLINSETTSEDVACENTTVGGPSQISREAAEEILNQGVNCLLTDHSLLVMDNIGIERVNLGKEATRSQPPYQGEPRRLMQLFEDA